MSRATFVCAVAGIAAGLGALAAGGAPGDAHGAKAVVAPGAIAYTVVRSPNQLYEVSLGGTAPRRIRRNDAVEYEPVVSPNGHRLAFVSTLGGSEDIYVSARNGSEQRRLTTSPEVEFDPRWSFDGRRLAWVRVHGGRGEIWVMRGDGNGQRRIVAGKDAQNPSWSPDGRHIVFWDARSEALYTVASGGGRVHRLTDGTLPDWSPSGKTIAFVREIDGTDTIMLWDVKSKVATRLLVHGQDADDDSWPSWSPDGRRIAFERYDYTSDSTDIWVAPADGMSARAVVATAADEFNPRFAPGARLTFTSSAAIDADIAIAEADGTQERMLVTGPDWAHDPTWSPDGSALAFTSDRGGTGILERGAGIAPLAAVNWDIYTVALDGAKPRRLTSSPAHDASPAWGPTGQIAFESDRSGDTELWVMGADGSAAKRVTRHEGWDGEPAWSPDGSHLVYSSERDDDGEIFVTSPDGADTIQVTRNDVDDLGPVWSPDGTLIAFASERGDGWEIWVAAPDGSNLHRVTRAADGEAVYPAWSADGNWILFSRQSDGLIRRIMRVRPNGTGLAPVTSGALDSWLPSAFVPA